MNRPTLRAGFTLLEVLLAMAIGVVLLGALYVALDVQIKSAQSARDVVERSTVVRTLFARMTNDISGAINLADPGRFRNVYGKSSSGSGMASSGTGSGSSSSSSSSSNSSSSSSNSSSSTPSNAATTYALPMGVVGDSTTLHVFTTRMPRELVNYKPSDTTLIPPFSDSRRITYWLVGGGNTPGGLAKQEVQPVTSDTALNSLTLPPTVDDATQYIIAEEVQSLAFSYYDGTTWLDNWDSRDLGADGVTPKGPPSAIRIEIGLPDGGEKPKIYRHVVFLVTANGNTPQGNSTPNTSP